jgi:hypothetical protein
MKTFWDTSAILNATVSQSVAAKLNTGEHVTRQHALCEFFSTITGRGIKYRDDDGQTIVVAFSPDDAVEWLKHFAGRVGFVELTAAETLHALEVAQSKEVSGARVYDFMHALAADKAGADELLTRNVDHFKGLTRAKVVWP